MAVEINAAGEPSLSVSLHGADAERFVAGIANPSRDERRLAHLARSDQTYARISSPEPVSELPTSK